MLKSARFIVFSFVAFVTTVFVTPVKAQQEAINFNIHQHYLSIRALGMGNAYSAVADDYDAIFYNPAGLGRVDEPEMSFQLRAGADPAIMDLVEDIDKAGKEENQTQAMGELIQKNYGKHYGVRAPTLGFLWGRKNWGIAFIPADTSLDIGVNQLGGPALNMRSFVDSTLALGLAKNWKIKKKHLISGGVTVKGVYRANYDRQILAYDLAVDNSFTKRMTEDVREGMTVDADIGILYTPHTEGGFFKLFQPSFSAVARNVADYGFNDMNLYNDFKGQKPEKLGRRFDVGSAIRLPDWWVWTSRLVVDFRDIGHEYYTFEKGFHLGLEFKWKLVSWFQGAWRAGIQQRFDAKYWTAGFSGRFAIFQLDVVSYAEEVGTSGAPKESRRHMVQLSSTF